MRVSRSSRRALLTIINRTQVLAIRCNVTRASATPRKKRPCENLLYCLPIHERFFPPFSLTSKCEQPKTTRATQHSATPTERRETSDDSQNTAAADMFSMFASATPATPTTPTKKRKMMMFASAADADAIDETNRGRAADDDDERRDDDSACEASPPVTPVKGTPVRVDRTVKVRDVMDRCARHWFGTTARS